MQKIILGLMVSVSIISVPPTYAQTSTSGTANNTSADQCEDNGYIPAYTVADDGASDSLSEAGSGETNASVKKKQKAAANSPKSSGPKTASTPKSPSTPKNEAVVRVPGANRTVGGQPIVVKSPGVRTSTLTFPMQSILNDIYAVAKRTGMPTPVITSGNDSDHKVGSRHYSGNAIDLRCNSAFASALRCAAFARELAKVLGRKYDVIWETFPEDPSNNHIHVEYDPK